MRAASVMALLAALAACPLPSEAAYNAAPATFQKDCSPADTPALKIIIPKGDMQMLVRLWGDAYTNLSSTDTFMFLPEKPRSQVTTDLYICASTNCAPGEGSLRIGQYKPGQMLDGEVTWTAPSGSPVSIPFVASYVALDPPCGE